MAEKSHAVDQILNAGLKFDLRAVRVRVKVRVGLRVRFRVGELASGTFQSSFYLHGRATAQSTPVVKQWELTTPHLVHIAGKKH